MVVACNSGDDGSDNEVAATPTADCPEPCEEALPTASNTVDTSVELPPAVTVDLSSRSDVLTVQPNTNADTDLEPTRSISGESTLPPAVSRPTNTFPPASARPTRTPRPTEPTRTPRPSRTPVPTVTLTPTLEPGACDGFAPDFEANDANERVTRGEQFVITWFAAENIPDVSYLVIIYNSNAGRIYEADTFGTSITIPENISNRNADTFLFWQVIVLSGEREVGCPALDGEVLLVG